MKTYKAHFACFACRKMFKKTPLSDYVGHVGLASAYQEIVRVYGSRPARLKVEEVVGVTYDEIRARYLRDVSVCPECSGDMAPMGLDFRPPPGADKEAWKILEVLYENGFAFWGCGCMSGYVPPQRLADVPAWLAGHQRKSEGQKLLEKIAARQ